ncbi:MAG TPA: FecR domain-containing protein [Cyclobacteriaceae bacterium]|nr:FecR domain-containing protein [Cyclobacteriaceae bacterium]
MEKSEFDRLLERYLNDNVTEQERLKIEAWLNVAKTKRADDQELDKEAEDRLFRKITGNLDKLDELVTLEPPSRKHADITQWTLRLAAALLVLAIVIYGVRYVQYEYQQTEHVAVGSQVDKLILSDGSLVWLRGDSKLVYYEKPGIRYSELVGEALFEVAKDPDHPFIIQCGDVRLKVLGTSFSVKAGADEVELKVLTGRVNLSAEKAELTVDVAPNEQVIYRGGAIERHTLTKDVVEAVTENTEYNMEFSNVPMEEVFRKIERKFNVRVRFANPGIGRCRITADLTDQSLESTLQMVTEVLGVTYSRRGGEVIFAGSGCN